MIKIEMQLKTFYFSEVIAKNIPSNRPVILHLDQAIKIANQVLREPDGFIGFIDPKNNTIQFHGDEYSGDVWVELPDPREQCSYGKYIKLTQVSSLIKSLPEIYSKDCIPGLEFRAW